MWLEDKHIPNLHWSFNRNFLKGSRKMFDKMTKNFQIDENKNPYSQETQQV